MSMAELEPNTILLAGNNASGKSTFSAALAAETGFPVVHLDAVLFSEQNDASATEQFEARKGSFYTKAEKELERQREIASTAGGIIIDGTYPSLRPITWDIATHIIFLDPPIETIMSRIFKRVTEGENEEFGNTAYSLGSSDALTKHPMYVAWKFHEEKRPKILAMLEEYRIVGRNILTGAELEVGKVLPLLK